MAKDTTLGGRGNWCLATKTENNEQNNLTKAVVEVSS
jgi:hypothetical protein